jgi:PRD domain protein (TIGR03582 family)
MSHRINHSWAGLGENMGEVAQVSEIEIQALAQRVLGQITEVLEADNKYLSDVQQMKMDSHIKAMARRSLTGEGLPDFDADLFDEISAPAMRLSEAVTAMFGNLPKKEALLLSIHFEMAKNK